MSDEGLVQHGKVAVARLLCAPAIGRLVAWWYSDQLPSGRCVIHTAERVIRAEVKAAIFWRFYESAEIRFVERHLPTDVDVVELGASIGVVSAHIARRLERGRSLVCVEANPQLLDALQTNATSNSRGARVSVSHGAISYDAATEVSFAIGERNIDSRLAGGPAGGVSVPVLTLSGVLRAHQLGEYALVTDIEGAEAFVFRDDAKALGRCRIIVAELHDMDVDGTRVRPDDFVRQLEQLGFDLIERHGPVIAMTRRTPWKTKA
jgi:FkbM family methyltransferase